MLKFPTGHPEPGLTLRDVRRYLKGRKCRSDIVHVLSPNGPPHRISLDRTPAGFCGTRLWMKCPACDRRVAILYLSVARLVCGRCASVHYPGRRLHRDRAWEHWGRAAHRLAKVRAVLARRYLRLARRGQLERLALQLEQQVCAGLLAIEPGLPTLGGMSAGPTTSS